MSGAYTPTPPACLHGVDRKKLELDIYIIFPFEFFIVSTLLYVEATLTVVVLLYSLCLIACTA